MTIAHNSGLEVLHNSHSGGHDGHEDLNIRAGVRMNCVLERDRDSCGHVALDINDGRIHTSTDRHSSNHRLRIWKLWMLSK